MRFQPLLMAAGLMLSGLAPALAINETAPDAQVLERSGEDGTRDSAPLEERQARSFAVIGVSRMGSDIENLGDAFNLDVALGLQLLGWLSVEGAAAITVAPGRNKGPRTVTTGPVPCTSPPVPVIDPDGTPDGCDPSATEPPAVLAEPGNTASNNRLQTTILGVFAVVRTPGKFYGVGKYGYRTVFSSIPEIQDGDRDGTAWSAGLGYRWGVGLSSLEVTHTKWSDHLDAVGLSLAYGFGASPGTGAH